MTRTALAAALALCTALPAHAAPLSAHDILQKARDQGALNLVGLQAQLTLTTTEPGGAKQTRVLTTQSRTIDGVTKTVSRFSSPPDVAGVALLTVTAKPGEADEVALYAPKVRRARKIAPGARGERFMDSEFSYADFSGASLDGAKPTRGPDATVNGTPCEVVTAEPPDSPYKKVIAAIDPKTFMPVQVQYFDDAGLLKTYTVLKTEVRLGHPIATESVMENARTHRKTALSVGQVEKADAPDAAFTLRGLERG